MESRVCALPAVSTKRLRQRRQHEPPLAVLGKNTDTRQCAQHAIQHVTPHSGLSTKLVRMLRSVRNQVGNSQLRRNEDRLRRPVTTDQLVHLSLEIFPFRHSASLS